MAHLTFEELRLVKSRLRELDQQWIRTKPGNKGTTTNYIEVDTVIQILEYATHGITTWDFEVVEQWREEVHKNFEWDKNKTPNWGFDNFVYHVKGRLTIHGLGSRMHFGKKVATGGANGQDSAYQAAASNCISKCASMFGVGERLYVQNTINADQALMNYNDRLYWKQHNRVEESYMQGNHIINTGQPVNQPQMPVQQEVYQPQVPQPQVSDNNPWATIDQNNQSNDNWAQEIAQVDHAVATNQVDYPFEVTPNYTAQPQGQAQENNVPVKEMGAPVNIPPVEQPQAPQQMSQEQQFFMTQVGVYKQHQQRLGLTDDNMIPYLRDYFKDENANTSFLTMDTIEGFNQHMNSIQR